MKYILKIILYMMFLFIVLIFLSVLYVVDIIVILMKSVIFFLGDGMGLIIVMVSCIYVVGENGKLVMDCMKYVVWIKIYFEDG